LDVNKLSADLEAISSGYAKKFGIDRTPEWFLLKLTEELGELVQSYLKYAGQARLNSTIEPTLRVDLEDELADVLGMTLLVAKNHNINIEQAITRKWLKHLNPTNAGVEK
jgi:NTP pyrophosphatase (non-canonical NTP hydrolase)